MTLQLPPLCILSVNSILGCCVALWNILIHNEAFHIFHTTGESKNRKSKVPCTVSVQFTQLWSENIFSYKNILFSTTRKDLTRSWNFSLFLFHWLVHCLGLWCYIHHTKQWIQSKTKSLSWTGCFAKVSKQKLFEIQEYLTVDDFEGKKWLHGNFVAETTQQYELHLRW